MEQTDVIEICEHLLGFKWFQHKRDAACRWLASSARNRGGWQICDDMALPIAADIAEFLPAISIDETATFDHVVSAMKAKNLLLLLFETKNGWFARFAPTGEDVDISQPSIEGVDWFASRNVSSPAEAICLAALSMIRGKQQ